MPQPDKLENPNLRHEGELENLAPSENSQSTGTPSCHM